MDQITEIVKMLEEAIAKTPEYRYIEAVFAVLEKDQEATRALRFMRENFVVIGFDEAVKDIIEQSWNAKITPEAAAQRVRVLPIKVYDDVQQQVLMNMPIKGTH